MDIKNNKQLSLLGLLQAVGVIIYVGLVAIIIDILEKINIVPPKVWGIMAILSLLVVSVAVCGALIFGYAAYIAFNKKITEAVHLVLYTLLYLIVLVIIIFTLTQVLFIL